MLRFNAHCLRTLRHAHAALPGWVEGNGRTSAPLQQGAALPTRAGSSVLAEVRQQMGGAMTAVAASRAALPAQRLLAAAERWIEARAALVPPAGVAARLAQHGASAVGILVGLGPVLLALAYRDVLLVVAALYGACTGFAGALTASRAARQQAEPTSETTAMTAAPVASTAATLAAPTTATTTAPTTALTMAMTTAPTTTTTPAPTTGYRGARPRAASMGSDIAFAKAAAGRALQWLDLAESAACRRFPGHAQASATPAFSPTSTPPSSSAEGDTPAGSDAASSLAPALAGEVEDASSVGDVGSTLSSNSSDSDLGSVWPRIHYVSDDSALNQLPRPGLDPLGLLASSQRSDGAARFRVTDLPVLERALQQSLGEALAAAQPSEGTLPTNAAAVLEADTAALDLCCGYGSAAMPSPRLLEARSINLATVGRHVDAVGVPLTALLANQRLNDRLSTVAEPYRQQLLAALIPLTGDDLAWTRAVLALAHPDVPARLRAALHGCPALTMTAGGETCALPLAAQATPTFFLEQQHGNYVLAHLGLVYQGSYPLGRHNGTGPLLQVEGPTFVGVRVAVQRPEADDDDDWTDLVEILDVWLSSNAEVLSRHPSLHLPNAPKPARGAKGLWFA